jgi:hypothetical protein
MQFSNKEAGRQNNIKQTAHHPLFVSKSIQTMKNGRKNGKKHGLL